MLSMGYITIFEVCQILVTMRVQLQQGCTSSMLQPQLRDETPPSTTRDIIH